MDRNVIEYTIKETARKSIQIKVSDGKLEVTAPYGTGKGKISDFVNSKRKWIDKKILEQQQSLSAYKNYLEYKKFLLFGFDCSIIFSGNRKRIYITDQGIFFPKDTSFGGGQDTAGIQKIKRAYRSFARSYLEERLYKIALQSNIKYNKISITDSLARWGSCSPEKNITLNWRLVMLDVRLIDYVIIHELCHVLHLDHSAAFWRSVSFLCPSYKKNRAELKSRSNTMKLFRM